MIEAICHVFLRQSSFALWLWICCYLRRRSIEHMTTAILNTANINIFRSINMMTELGESRAVNEGTP